MLSQERLCLSTEEPKTKQGGLAKTRSEVMSEQAQGEKAHFGPCKVSLKQYGDNEKNKNFDGLKVLPCAQSENMCG